MSFPPQGGGQETEETRTNINLLLQEINSLNSNLAKNSEEITKFNKKLGHYTFIIAILTVFMVIIGILQLMQP